MDWTYVASVELPANSYKIRHIPIGRNPSYGNAAEKLPKSPSKPANCLLEFPYGSAVLRSLVRHLVGGGAELMLLFVRKPGHGARPRNSSPVP